MKTIFVTMLVLVIAACGGESWGDAASGGSQEAGLTQSELENGIGPVSSISLGEIDRDLAELGEEIFKTKCSACHKMDERYVGPPLGNVLESRTPAFVMNMMLNPEEMLKRHPTARAMLTEYMTPMPDQQLTQDDARAVLEYLRHEADEE